MELFNVHWSSYNRRKSYTVGFLIYDNTWIFKYNTNHIHEAIQHGFRPFPSMEDINQIYQSTELFPTFLCRYKNNDKSSILTFMKDLSGELITDKILIKHLKDKGCLQHE